MHDRRNPPVKHVVASVVLLAGIKIACTGDVLSDTDTGMGPLMTDEELVAVVQTVHALGHAAFCHAHTTAGINAALRAGVDSIEHGAYLDAESIELLKRTGGGSGIHAAGCDPRGHSLGVRHLRIANQVGVLKAAMAADLIAVDGNPLQDVTVLEHVRFVTRSGRTCLPGPVPRHPAPG
jgi:imidazolonepropionase-like amidohydrolase